MSSRYYSRYEPSYSYKSPPPPPPPPQPVDPPEWWTETWKKAFRIRTTVWSFLCGVEWFRHFEATRAAIWSVEWKKHSLFVWKYTAITAIWLWNASCFTGRYLALVWKAFAAASAATQAEEKKKEKGKEKERVTIIEDKKETSAKEEKKEEVKAVKAEKKAEDAEVITVHSDGLGGREYHVNDFLVDDGYYMGHPHSHSHSHSHYPAFTREDTTKSSRASGSIDSRDTERTRDRRSRSSKTESSHSDRRRSDKSDKKKRDEKKDDKKKSKDKDKDKSKSSTKKSRLVLV
ncbi:uncharacterized protein BCR38DRAFT_405064 [Pseudomassariella vexata]|uniref:Uncharacterized protein n=1 Tax=Pseudomassariella vexata TaxID=1141098 RepID=A0A1Y2EKJ6_9PEZI|nr:uncharacterized protein BCR38DRAFT_405064 [Pseudomassariella vexata]ORY72058.1 hypothetical protein BCR38DRAFT_405064 [Pseudomassariella vexata]